MKFPILLLFQDELEFNRSYEDAEENNFQLNEQLNRLQGQIFVFEIHHRFFFLSFVEQYDRIYLEWSCELCTYTNPSYIETRRDVCEICESPSPMKRSRNKDSFVHLFCETRPKMSVEV
jgi:hypothetical protein